MMMNNEILIDILGWIGAGGLLIAYALVSAKRVEGDSTGYQLLNTVGSIFLMINTIHYRAYPSALLNLFWLGVAIYAMRKAIVRYLAS